MKLKQLLSILDKECEVTIIDSDGVGLISKVKDIKKDLKERTVKSLYKSYFENQYDFIIFLKP